MRLIDEPQGLQVERWKVAANGKVVDAIEVRAYGESAEIISRAVDDILSRQVQDEELPAPTAEEGVGS